MLGRALGSVFWGKVADRYGRKPVIIIGTSTVYGTDCPHRYLQLAFTSIWFIVEIQFLMVHCRVIFNTLFGLSLNYWMAIITRFLLGCLNGLLGPIKVISLFLLVLS